MDEVDKIIFECVDEALAEVLSSQKQEVYHNLQEFYGLKPEDIAKQYDVFYDAINNLLEQKIAFQLTRRIVQILHERSQNKTYREIVAVEAFSRIITINVQKSEQRIKASQERYQVKEDQLKQQQQQLMEQKVKLEEVRRLAAIGQTAGMVGHDIRNPLQSITGELYLIRSEAESLPEGDAKKNIEISIDIIQENIRYINKIVADLQDYARHVSPRKEYMSLKTAVSTALSVVTIPNDIQVSVQMNPDQTGLFVDKDLIKRILTNLIQNAIQAMPKGGKLTIKACHNDDKTTIKVTDTGVGIPKEAEEKIFTPLFTTKAKGQGLGLAVVKRLVEAQGGAISFESEEDKGTTFTIQFPTQ